MRENESKKPKIRFQGFNDEWVESELGEVTEVHDGTHQTPRYTNQGIMFLSVENIKTLISNKYISEEDFKNEFKNYPQKGDVLMTRIGDVGTANVVENDIKKAYYVSLALLKKKSLNPYFLKNNIHSESVQKDIWQKTLHIAFPKKINKNEISRVNIKYPIDEKEQNEIGNIFRNIDNLISQKQKKYDKLVQMKSVMLEKMFPKENESVPEVRFSGFSDEWEENVLGGITTYIKGFAFKTKDYRKEGTRLIRVSDLTKDTISENSDKIFIEELEALKYCNYTINKGDIIITTVGSKSELIDSAVGRPIIVDKDNGYLLNQNLVKITSKKGFYSKFINSQLLNKRFRKYIANIERGNANQANIAINDVWEYYMQTPNCEEQQKIGNYFKALDNLITLQQKEIEKLKNIKKALLEKMFV